MCINKNLQRLGFSRLRDCKFDLEEGENEDTHTHTHRCSSPPHKMSDLQQKSLMKEMMTRVLTSTGTRLLHKREAGGGLSSNNTHIFSAAAYLHYKEEQQHHKDADIGVQPGSWAAQTHRRGRPPNLCPCEVVKQRVDALSGHQLETKTTEGEGVKI